MNKIKKITKKILTGLLNLLFGVCCVMFCLFLVQIFCITSFKIPSDSMDPTLQDGDYIIVNKMVNGARLFNVFSALNNEEVNIVKMPRLSKFKRNDVLVFNFPYEASRWDSIRLDIMQYYVKRCIALPGDTLEIRNGYYKVRGCNELLGNRIAQSYLSALEEPEKKGIVTGTFPYDEQLGWNIHEFGPLPIPQKGQEITMNHTNYILYRNLINWEQKKKLRSENGQYFLKDSLINKYCFIKNYYFVSGDNMPNSQDSRYWGMLPEEYIVGKATHIWNSKDRYTKKIRWERILKKIS